MCYTAASNLKKKEIETRFQVQMEDAEYTPYYSVSAFLYPKLPVICSDHQDEAKLIRWGLIPHWVKSHDQLKDIRMQTLNAKCETIFEKPSFRTLASRKKCCVIVNGFFEWQTNGKAKQPYFIYLKNHEPFAFGGLWDEWADIETGEIIRTFSVITTPANPMMEKIHNVKLRMPLILEPGKERDWLNTVDRESTQQFLHPFPEQLMDAHKVSKLVSGRSGDPNVPEVQEPVAEEPVQGSLF